MKQEREAKERGPARLVRGALGALSGLLAAFAALAVAEPVSAAVGRASSPVTAVGASVIDATPTAVKEFAVRNFGTNDKLYLTWGTFLLLGLFALALGLLALRHRRLGAAGVLLFGVLGTVAAVSRPDAGPSAALPSVIGALAGTVVLYVLVGRLGPRDAAPGPAAAAAADAEEPAAAAEPGATGALPLVMRPHGEGAGTFDRRGFVIAATAAAAASAGAGFAGRRLNAASGAEAAASRKAVALPAPASPAAPLPRGVHPEVPGLSSFVTPNADFYRVDTALVVPKVDATDWRLRLHGKGVSKPLTMSFQDLLAERLIERDITLTCVSNEVGGPYVGHARWIGLPLGDLLREAGVRPPSEGGPADQLVARSVDGMTLGTPVETVMDGRDAMLAVGMNGRPLPFDHGFPVRMVVPGLFGYVSACKWIEELELTTFDDYDPYWVRRGWSREAPVKTQSRIDTPKPFAGPKAGPVPVAGVAWAQHTGIDRVEVRVDEGPWNTARLAPEATEDTWRQWVWEWEATPGSHTLQVRATDRSGRTQTDERVGTVPDGATGRHSVVVDVT